MLDDKNKCVDLVREHKFLLTTSYEEACHLSLADQNTFADCIERVSRFMNTWAEEIEAKLRQIQGNDRLFCVEIDVLGRQQTSYIYL